MAMNSNHGREQADPHPGHVSDRLLRLFDAAARLGSLSAAARSMAVGQPAVSHAIARLEEALGTTLFDRSPSGVVLTEAGRQLHDATRGPLAEIDRALVDIRSRPDDHAVTMSVSTSLASFWLMPRLPAFKRGHPDLDLRVITSDSDRDVGLDDADLWIPLGRVTDRQLDGVELCPEEVVPVAAPSLADGLDPTPDGLQHAPLLHLEERYAPRFDWPRWFRHHQLEPPDLGHGYRSNDYSLVLQAAIEGQGVALGWHHIVRSLIDSGQLVPMGEIIRTDEPFQVLHRASSELRPPARALRDWLRAEMGRSQANDVLG